MPKSQNASITPRRRISTFDFYKIYPIHLFGEISRRGEISLKMTNIALVRALRI